VNKCQRISVNILYYSNVIFDNNCVCIIIVTIASTINIFQQSPKTLLFDNISLPNAIEIFYDNALYKSMIYLCTTR